MFNLRSRKSGCEDVFLRKRWCVAINSQHVADKLGQNCFKGHKHMRVCGSDTKFPEVYTEELAEAVHRAIAKEAINLKWSTGTHKVLCC